MKLQTLCNKQVDTNQTKTSQAIIAKYGVLTTE